MGKEGREREKLHFWDEDAICRDRMHRTSTRLWGKYKEFDFGLFKFEVMVGYPGGAVQQTLGNMRVRLVWKWRFRKIVEP